ncbi:MAG: CHASE2 domain-containing protein, partial [Gammaproteobacteria bacterium]
MRRWLKALIAGIATALTGTILGLMPLGADFEQGVGLRWLFQLRGAIEPPSEVIVVGIDDQTGTHLGLSALPREWPRSVHARLIERLVERGASVIVFDFDFERPKLREHDLAFAQAIADSDRVVLVEKLSGKRQPIADRKGRHKGFVWVEQLIPPMPRLVEVAKGLGPFPLPKMEAAVHGFWAFKPSLGDAPTAPAVALQIHALASYRRWLQLLAEVGAARAEALPPKADDLSQAPQIRELMRQQRQSFKQDPELGTKLRYALDGADKLEPTERQLMQALVSLYQGGDHRYLNFYGPPGTITTIPYHAVVKGDAPNREALDFTKKIVFVGYSDLYDPGQPDRHYTVFTRDDGVDLSGVEIAATAFGNLLTDRWLRPSAPLM